MNNTAHNSTGDYYLLNTVEGMWGMIPTMVLNLFILLLAVIMSIGHNVHQLPIHLVRRCLRKETEPNSKAPLQVLCVLMVIFGILRVVFSVTKEVSYILSYKDTGTDAYQKSIDVIYGISIFTLAIGIGMYLIVISQVIHIWLRVVKALDCDQRFGPWFFKVLNAALVVIGIGGVIVIIPAGAVLAVPFRVLSLQRKLVPIIIFTSLFGVLMVSLTLLALGVGSYVLIIVYKSHVKHQSTKKMGVMIRMAAFIVLFLICAYVQVVGLIVSTNLSAYYAYLLIQACPETFVVFFMCIIFWPFKLFCFTHAKVAQSSETATELQEASVVAKYDDVSPSEAAPTVN